MLRHRGVASPHAAFRWGQQRCGRAGSLSFNNREHERQVLWISVRRPGVVCDLHVEKPFLAHHVSHDFFEATQRLTLERPPWPQVRTVCLKPLAEFLPSRSRQVELFGADDLDAGNDVMSLHRYAMNAT